MTKPREWTTEFLATHPETGKTVDVVLKSAYLDAVRALDEANIALARMFSDAGRLTEERDKYKAALTEIADRKSMPDVLELRAIASEALREGYATKKS